MKSDNSILDVVRMVMKIAFTIYEIKENRDDDVRDRIKKAHTLPPHQACFFAVSDRSE